MPKNCSRSAEVITLSMKPSTCTCATCAGTTGAGKKFSAHITDFYIQQFIAQSGLSLGPWRIRPDEPLIKATKADINRGRELLNEIPATLGFDQARHRRVDFSERLVVIHPGSGGLHKCWHLDNFLAVAKELISRGIEVIFLLGPAELERFSKANLKKINSVAGCLTDLSLTQVLGLLGCADWYLGNDSGITHLAAALGVRTLAVFGPTPDYDIRGQANPELYKPIGPAVTVFASRTKAFAKKPSAKLQQELLNFF